MDIKEILKQNEKPVPQAKQNEFQLILDRIKTKQKKSIFSYALMASSVAAVLVAVLGFQFKEQPVTDDELAELMEDTYTYFDVDTVVGSDYLSMIE